MMIHNFVLYIVLHLSTHAPNISVVITSWHWNRYTNCCISLSFLSWGVSLYIVLRNIDLRFSKFLWAHFICEWNSSPMETSQNGHRRLFLGVKLYRPLSIGSQWVDNRNLVKAFDTLIQPILLYCSEVWGGFGHSVAIEGFVVYIGGDISCTLNVVLLVQYVSRRVVM